MIYNTRLPIIALACLIPIWLWAIIDQFPTDSDYTADKPNSRETSVAQKRAPVNLNPTINKTQPDLNNGYLFNKERFLKSFGTETANTENGNQSINMESLQYSGSIITDNMRKAIISFEENTPKTGQSRKKKSSNPRVKPTRTNRLSKIISEGDNVAGYTLETVEPLQLIFTRGSEEIQKKLFSTEKQRKEVPVVQKRKPTPTTTRKPTTKTTPNTSATKNRRPTSPPTQTLRR